MPITDAEAVVPDVAEIVARWGWGSKADPISHFRLPIADWADGWSVGVWVRGGDEKKLPGRSHRLAMTYGVAAPGPRIFSAHEPRLCSPVQGGTAFAIADFRSVLPSALLRCRILFFREDSHAGAFASPSTIVCCDARARSASTGGAPRRRRRETGQILGPRNLTRASFSSLCSPRPLASPRAGVRHGHFRFPIADCLVSLVRCSGWLGGRRDGGWEPGSLLPSWVPHSSLPFASIRVIRGQWGDLTAETPRAQRGVTPTAKNAEPKI